MRIGLVLVLLAIITALGFAAFIHFGVRTQAKAPIPAPKATKTSDRVVMTRPPAKASPIRFADVTEPMGLDTVSFSGATPEKHFPTANGTGVAMIDFDQDGWLDLYFPNSCRLDGDLAAPPNALWRSRGGQSFEHIVESSGTDATGFTQGVAVSDFNNDGFPDVYLVRYGPDILLENNGDGTFRDSTDSANVGDPRWGTSAAFLDYDEDGNLDLYVANYGKWDMDWHLAHPCGPGTPPIRIYCSPKILEPEVHSLYHSLGDGTFVDVAAELGIARPDSSERPGGRGQGVVAADVNGDGHVDIYVANDLCPNFLFINTGHGTFEDHTESSCAAYNSEGQSEAGMGVDACDVDGNGLPELFVTNFYLEHNTLYQNLGKNLFNDVSHWSGVAAGSVYFVGWGTGLEDFDEDGWADIFVANGHVDDNLSQLDRDEPYAQLPGLWRNASKGRFEKMQSGIGSYFDTPHVGRGVAFGDIDNDGAMDVVIAHKDEPAVILRNDSRAVPENAQHAWIQLRLTGMKSNRDAVGTSIECHTQSGVIHRQIKGGRSYLSASDLRLCIGLGSTDELDRVIIRWPSGATQELTNLRLRQLHSIREPR
jgi:hypothetical protein